MRQGNNVILSNPDKVRRENFWRKWRYNFFLQLLLVILSAMYLYIFLWMVATALKSESAFTDNSLTLLVKNPQWSNFVKVTRVIPFWRYLKNTTILVIGTVIGTVLSSSLVGYSFAKLRWPGRDICFLVLLATMMLPSTVLQIPTFIMFTKFGWRNTFLPIIIPTFFGGGAFNIYLTREFYRGINNALLEAAKIDGCSHFKIWWNIMVPLCIPVSLTVAISTFMGTWNDFMNPLIYIDIPEKFPLVLGLRSFQQQYQTQWDMMMAGSVLSMLPTIVVYFVFQKYFMEGISVSSGVKG